MSEACFCHLNGYAVKDATARADIGTKASLNTTVKTDLVAAINEVNTLATGNATDIGTKSSLDTTAKTNLVAAINEVKGLSDTANTDIGTKGSLSTIEKGSLVGAINELKTRTEDIGTLSSLTTTNKTSVVVAINELDSEIGSKTLLATTEKTTIVGAINEIVNTRLAAATLSAHPIGSLYWSTVSTTPAELFGGTWEQVKDKFILAAGDSYSAGTTGGSADAVVVAHTHTDSNRGFISSSDRIAGTGLDNVTVNASSYTTKTYDTGSTGVSGTGKNMPPYEVAYCWKRTA